jgi:hypothetical protein
MTYLLQLSDADLNLICEALENGRAMTYIPNEARRCQTLIKELRELAARQEAAGIA